MNHKSGGDDVSFTVMVSNVGDIIMKSLAVLDNSFESSALVIEPDYAILSHGLVMSMSCLGRNCSMLWAVM